MAHVPARAGADPRAPHARGGSTAGRRPAAGASGPHARDDPPDQPDDREQAGQLSDLIGAGVLGIPWRDELIHDGVVGQSACEDAVASEASARGG